MWAKRRYALLVSFILAALIGTVKPASAQNGDMEDNPPPSTCLPTDPDYDPRLCVPIDGGLAFLLAAGIGYGVLKNRSSHKKAQENASGSAVNE